MPHRPGLVGGRRIGVLAGAFNPVTRAHLALVEAARGSVDEIVCVVPRVYPHKEFHGANLEKRLEMLRRASDAYGVEVTGRGLFIEIARELKEMRPDAEIHFICGRDAAERIVGWDYGAEGAIERMLGEFQLLVASRNGEYVPPHRLRNGIRSIPLASGYDDVSSTEVRRRIAKAEPWEHLVPDAIVDLVRETYSRDQIL